MLLKTVDLSSIALKTVWEEDEMSVYPDGRLYSITRYLFVCMFVCFLFVINCTRLKFINVSIAMFSLVDCYENRRSCNASKDRFRDCRC